MHAQTATEYIILSAVVLTIGGAIMASVGSLPQLNVQTTTATDQLELIGMPIGILQFSFVDSSIVLVLRNNVGEPVNITQISVGSVTCDNSAFALMTGQKKVFTCENSYSESTLNSTHDVVIEYITLKLLEPHVQEAQVYSPRTTPVATAAFSLSSYVVRNATIYANFTNPTSETVAVADMSSAWGNCIAINDTFPLLIGASATKGLMLDCTNVSYQTMTYNTSITSMNYSIPVEYRTNASGSYANDTTTLSGTASEVVVPLKAVGMNIRAIGMNANGTAFAFGQNAGPLYVSVDSRQTWKVGGSNGYWAGVAVSSNGSYITAVRGTNAAGSIYTSNDSGVTWVARASSQWWTSVAMSYDGVKQTAVGLGPDGFGGQIYVSNDSGVTWVARESNRTWSSVAMSSDGVKQTAVVAAWSGTRRIYTSNDSGATWTSRDSDRYWDAVAVSANGTYQTAVVSGGQIYISNNSGVTWTARDSNRAWSSVSMSASGAYQTAVVTGGYIYTSSNYGVSWTSRATVNNWEEVKVSANGSIQVVLDQEFDSKFRVSNDYGVTWTPDEVTYWGQTFGKSSTDGRIQTICRETGNIYTSHDGGNSWTARNSNRNWSGLSMSADGQYQTAIVNPGQIYTSNDSGVTWTARDSNRNWRGIAMSDNGTYQSAIVDWGKIYTSNNSGVSWTARDSDLGWTSIAMSANGSYQSVSVSYSPIHTSNDTGVTWSERDSAGWERIRVSSDGQTQMVIPSSGTVYVSTNGGVSFVSRDSSRSRIDLFLSSNGKYAVAYVDGDRPLYVSQNYGTSWTARDYYRRWSNVIVSSDGMRMSANGLGLTVFISHDGGVIWRPVDP